MRNSGPIVTDGKMAGDLTWLSSSFQDNTTEAFRMGTNVVFKGDNGWETPPAPGGGGGGGGGGFNPGARIARQLQNVKGPAADVADLVSKAKDITKDGDAYSGDLTTDGAKALATGGFGRRGGTPPTDGKGSVKFWVKDGMLTKYESKVSGKRTNQNGDETEFERTTTIEYKDIGTTKLNLPDDAKKKLSGS